MIADRDLLVEKTVVFLMNMKEIPEITAAEFEEILKTELNFVYLCAHRAGMDYVDNTNKETS